MFNWFNMKKKSLPEQVLQNTKDIEKLFDEELSDITQLNYKQDAEDSLTYADGKATFKGKMNIIRNENTQNLVVDSEIEVNISSGDDDIIIDAGEDNVSLKIRLDNETRNKINRALLIPINAPTERSFVMVGINNSEVIVGEKELLQRNIITAILPSDFIPDNVQTETKLPLTYDNGIGDKLSFSNGNIIVGNGVSKVKINALVSTTSTAESDTGAFYIKVNGQAKNIRAMVIKGFSTHNSASLSPYLLNVNAGDEISLNIYLDKAESLIMGSSSTRRTYLTVEVIE